MTIDQLTLTGEHGHTMVCLVDDEMLSKYRQHEDGVTPAQVVDSFDIMKFESGEKLHSIIEDSFKKFVILQIYVLSKASRTTMLLSEVARSNLSPLLLNFIILISL